MWDMWLFRKEWEACFYQSSLVYHCNCIQWKAFTIRRKPEYKIIKSDHLWWRIQVFVPTILLGEICLSWTSISMLHVSSFDFMWTLSTIKNWQKSTVVKNLVCCDWECVPSSGCLLLITGIVNSILTVYSGTCNVTQSFLTTLQARYDPLVLMAHFYHC